MTQLKEITGRYMELSEMAANPEIELTHEMVADTLDAIEGEFNEKAQSVVAVIGNIGSDIEAIDNEIKRLQARKKVFSNRDASIRNYLKINMEASGISNIKCPLFSITLADGRDMVNIVDEQHLPDEYITVKTEVKPDKKAILEALKNDPSSVEGAELIKSEKSLRIK